MKKLLENKKLLAILIVIVFLLVAAALKMQFQKLDAKKSQPKEVKKQATKEIDVDGVKHTIDLRVTIKVPPAITEKINYKTFAKDFEKFLDDNKLMADNTTAKAIGTVCQDVETEDVSFALKVNNTAGTVIYVTVKKNGKITYEYR